MSDVFSKFAPFIQEYIYRNGWTELRQIQTEAAEVIFGSDVNLLLTTPTASGKTEAAFFPIISELYERPADSFGVLYIAPLKSLINDQFGRIEELLKESEIPVYHFHGDVAASHKTKALNNPKGIIQITPESLESMLINRSNDIFRLFCDLRYVVIDELHTLTGSDRGNQIICQLVRIGQIIGYHPRRVGLSATVGDVKEACDWLALGSGRSTACPEVPRQRLKWRLGLEQFFIGSNGLAENDKENGENESPHAPITAQKGLDLGYSYVYDCTRDRKCLVFSNSREETEYVTATLRQIAEKRGEPDVFSIHHGNLSAAIREGAELDLKNDEVINTTCATVTLELGIDIGKLERIIQIEAPNSVSAMLQRLGRSGRRGSPPEMMMVFREELPLPDTPLPQLIPWQLIQAIAVIQLYAEERFIEPPIRKRLPYSLLLHQTLSVLKASGELTPARLAAKVMSLPPFENVSRESYRTLLLSMIQNDFIERTETGGLIVGLEGERLTSSFKFYAVFKDSEDFTVRCGSDEIGTITSPPPVGDRFALAGRVWEVNELDIKGKLVFVTHVGGKMQISWPGDYGEIHTKILKRMKQVLSEDIQYPYLKEGAKKRLAEARAIVKRTDMLSFPIVHLGGYSYALFPWVGTKQFRTLRKALAFFKDSFRLSAIDYGRCYYITFRMENGTPEQLYQALKDKVLAPDFNAYELAESGKNPIFDKYDEYIPSELLKEAYAADRLSNRIELE